ESGCLVVLVDLHDADGETLAVAEYLADNLDHEPVLVIGTVRAEPGPALDLARTLGRRRPGSVLEPAALTAAGVRRLAAGCLRSDAVPATVLHSVAARADRLGPRVRAVLNAAAVLGRRFPTAVVEAMTGLDRPDLL